MFIAKRTASLTDYLRSASIAALSLNLCGLVLTSYFRVSRHDLMGILNLE